MTGVNGIIGYLLGTKQTSITIAELKQIFGEQAVSYSEMMGSYQALFYWEGFLID